VMTDRGLRRRAKRRSCSWRRPTRCARPSSAARPPTTTD
jgi:hypothetical protein